MKTTLDELKTVHPHKFYNLKSGTNVKHSGLSYMFMGYVDKKQCLLADNFGNKFVTFLKDLN